MILFDLSPLKAGGGCQLALNFLAAASEEDVFQRNYVFLLPDVGPLARAHLRFTPVFVSKRAHRLSLLRAWPLSWPHFAACIGDTVFPSCTPFSARAFPIRLRSSRS